MTKYVILWNAKLHFWVSRPVWRQTPAVSHMECIMPSLLWVHTSCPGLCSLNRQMKTINPLPPPCHHQNKAAQLRFLNCALPLHGITPPPLILLLLLQKPQELRLMTFFSSGWSFSSCYSSTQMDSLKLLLFWSVCGRQKKSMRGT